MKLLQRDVNNGFYTFRFLIFKVFTSMIALKPALIYSEPVDISCVLSVLKEGVGYAKEIQWNKI